MKPKLKLDYTTQEWCELLFSCFAIGTLLIIVWLIYLYLTA